MTKGHKFSGHAKTYILVWLSLLFLTGVTVTVSYFDFGDWNVFVSMLVATIKAALVCLFFMHLKYDNKLNQVVFVSTLAFLAVFISLTGADEWYRKDIKPMKVTDLSSASLGGEEIKKLMVATPEEIAKGKEIFNVQCVVCHGANGKGDGPAATALNPKPRDFTSGYWRFGGTPAQVFHTITNGSPGTGMAGFGTTPIPDRWALVAFVRSLFNNTSTDTPETLKASGIDLSASAGAEAAKPSETLPIAFAMQRYAEPNVGVTDLTAPSTGVTEATSTGQKIYQAQCMNCHGVSGKGGIPVSVVSFVNEKTRTLLKTKDLALSKEPWTMSQSSFVETVSKGLPGRNMPGFADYTAEEWNALYQYVLGLRVR